MTADDGLSWTPAGLLMAGSLCAAVAVMAARPDRSGAAIAVFPPWWSNSRAFAAAAGVGPVLGFGPWRGSVVVRRGDGQGADQSGSGGARPSQSDAMAARLHRAGAMLIVSRVLGMPCVAQGTR